MSFTEAPDPPTDIISKVKFSPDSSSLLVSSWDGNIRLYTRNVNDAFELSKKFNCKTPVFDVCWGTDVSTFYAVGIDRGVTRFAGDQKETMSMHEKASNRVAYSKEYNILLSTSWDGTMHVHNPDSKKYIRIGLPTKAFDLSITAERAVVAMAQRKLNVYELQDLWNLLDSSDDTEDPKPKLSVEPWQERLSSLKHITRAVACMSDGQGFAVGSIEGRCGVEWFDPERASATYVFKCHRIKTVVPDEEKGDTEVEVIYPVNALVFHPVFGSLLTGGGDGLTAFWDPMTRRRIRLNPTEAASVAAMDISPNAQYLAVAISPGFEDENMEENPDQEKIKVLVRMLGANEGKVKQKK